MFLPSAFLDSHFRRRLWTLPLRLRVLIPFPRCFFPQLIVFGMSSATLSPTFPLPKIRSGRAIYNSSSFYPASVPPENATRCSFSSFAIFFTLKAQSQFFPSCLASPFWEFLRPPDRSPPPFFSSEERFGSVKFVLSLLIMVQIKLGPLWVRSSLSFFLLAFVALNVFLSSILRR